MAAQRNDTGDRLACRDWRSTAGPMRPLSIKLPADLIAALDRHADAYRTPRAVLARELLAQGLEGLQAPRPAA